MPKLSWIAGSLLLWASMAWAVENGTYIEQKVTQNAKGGKTATVEGLQKIWFTSSMLRNEMAFGGQTNVAIIDLGSRTILLMPSDAKQYIEMKLDDYQKIVTMRIKNAGLSDPEISPKLSATGEQKKIGQWQCSKYVFEQEGRVPVKTELWVSKDTGIDFAAYLDLMKKMGMEQMLGKLASFVSSIEGYPIEVTTVQTVESQHVESTTRVQKIVVGPVDPALFKVPADYKKLGGDAPLGK